MIDGTSDGGASVDGSGEQGEVHTPAAGSTGAHSDAEKEQKKTLIGILSYLSILVVAAYFMGKDDPSTHFHIRQGVVLFVFQIATWVVVSMIPFLFPIMGIIHVGLVILAIIGIANVLRKKERVLPFIGEFAKHVPF